MKITKNRLRIIGAFALVLVVIILLIVLLVKSCSSDKTPKEGNTEAIASQNVVSQQETTAEPPNEYMIDSVVPLLQDGLDAGCEVYACTVQLQYLGFDIDEFEFAENYLVTSPIHYDDSYQRYGPDMNSAYAGDLQTGYGIYAPGMAKCMNNYLSTQNTEARAYPLQGVDLDTLCTDYVANDIPVMVWATTYMIEPYEKASWIIDYVDENADSQLGDTEVWLEGEHCMTLVGYDEENYYFADSMYGEITAYEKEISKDRYAKIGSQAIVVK